MKEDNGKKDVDKYIAKSDKKVQARMKQMRSCIRSEAKGAKEGLKWGMPSFSYHRILVTYAPFKNHIGLYPTPKVVKQFSAQLAKYRSGKGSIQFPHDKPLPLALIKKIIKLRVKESLEKDEKWM